MIYSYNYAAFETGSSSLPWIKNPRDKDIIIFVKNINKELEQHIKEIKKPKRTIILKCYSSFNTIDFVLRMYWIVYMIPYFKNICNNGIEFDDIKNKYDIYKEEISNIIKPRIKKGMYYINEEDIYENWYMKKKFYHIVTYIWFYENYELTGQKDYLTEEQVEIINKIHDRVLSNEEYAKLFHWIKEKVKNW